ncbi:PREDICTED: uncharacterized protein LOC106745440 [Dinoponera quadriceps]|uniref:Uncharacterized protein LOC106745440 n=1 Tax=Dinoponera quadriceps TaxID=609295 RepID=A0A6P3XE89_DINQU|nr:PREDICTED: uncharacterized protein LOC106745440 [Dinoponera quadriceps]
MLEAQFVRYGILDQPSRFHHLLMHLSEDLITLDMEKIINSARPESMYSEVKEALLKSHSESAEQKVRRLISELHLDNEPPSQLLRRMQRVANSEVGPSFVRQIWLDRLPRDLRVALAFSEHLPVDNLAELADRIWHLQSNNSSSQLLSLSASNKPADDDTAELRTCISDLSLEVRQLKQQLSQLRSQLQQQRSRSSSRKCAIIPDANADKNNNETANSKQEGASLAQNHKLCFYHRKFGAKARRCQDPCEWAKN